MWKIEVTKNGVVENHLWHNGHKDDFARFMPENFNVSSEALKFYKLDINAMKNFNNLCCVMDGDAMANYTDLSELGSVKVKQVSDDAVILNIVGQEVLWSQMYDAQMNFILNA